MAVLHPFIKRFTGLYDLWVLYSVLFLPGTAFSLTIYLAYSLLISFLDIHLMVQSFTLLMCNIVGSQSFFKKELLSICTLPFSQFVCLSIIMNPFPWSCQGITLSESLIIHFFANFSALSFHLAINSMGFFFYLCPEKRPFQPRM